MLLGQIVESCLSHGTARLQRLQLLAQRLAATRLKQMDHDRDQQRGHRTRQQHNVHVFPSDGRPSQAQREAVSQSAGSRREPPRAASMQLLRWA